MTFQKKLIKSLEEHRDSIAIETGSRKLSYTDVSNTANRVAYYLQRQHLENEVIAIQLDNRVDIICAIIGVINARCVFSPLDRAWPLNRICGVLHDMQIKYTICSRYDPGAAQLPEGVSKIFWEDLMSGDADVVPMRYPSYQAEDSIYLYFTSGTTGTPKGVIGRNDSLLQFIQWETETFHVNENFRFSQFVSPYFDAFLRDIFVPLLSGATICIPSGDEVLASPENMIKWIDESGITLIHCVPSLFRLFNNSQLLPAHFSKLKYILLSGEKIIPSELKPWFETFGDRIQLVNLYGATETTMIRAYYMIQPGDTILSRIPVGFPIADTGLLITTKGFEPCEQLLPGDLYIISDYMSKGYMNAPELMQEKFIKIPAGPLQGKLAFRTGDIARMLADGRIELLGREDRQVKLRGIRIELDGIELLLMQSGLVKEVAVIKQEEGSGNELLIAFAKVNPELKEKEGFQDALQKYMGNYMPDYMIPSNVVEVDEFPLLSSGKINYKKLLTLLDAVSVVPPANDIEVRLLSIWKGILDDKAISVNDSFSRLGGNSLNMVKLMARIYKEYRVRIPLKELFNHNTIRMQAELIKKTGRDHLMILLPAEKKPSYHLSLSAERIYYHWTLDKVSTAFNLPLGWRVNEAADKRRIKAILETLIQRHESLRTVFDFVSGKLVQVVKEAIDFELEELDGSNGMVNDAITDFIRPFDLNKGPLLRAGLIEITETQKILILDIHHIVCDGISQSNLAEDFWKLYRGIELTPLRIQYKDYAEWEYDFRSSETYLSQREFWLRSFEGEIPQLTLPSLRQATVNETDGGIEEFHLESSKLSMAIRGLQEEGVTPSSLLFSAFFIFMMRLTGQQDVIIGTGASGRMQDELEGVVGMFAKTLPIHCSIETHLTFRDFLLKTHRYLMEAYNMQLYDLADIVNELSRKRGGPVEKLVEVMFIYQDAARNKLWQEGDPFSSLELPGTTAKFPLSLFVFGKSDPMVFRFEYSSAYFTKDSMDFLAGQFKELLERILMNMDMPITAYISDYERTDMVEGENITFNF